MNQQRKFDYRFSATMLDAYEDFLDANAEDFFYQDDAGRWHRNYNEETGEYHFTESEVYELAKKELIDKINRVEFTPSEAASKGTALNEIVDSILEHRKAEGVTVTRMYEWLDGRQTDKVVGLQAAIDGFTFPFSTTLCREVADYFQGSVCQMFTSAPLQTCYGLVELYGYADYVREDKVFDLKTTKKYNFGKYEKKWQKHVYPYTLITSGKCTDVKAFEYTCYKLSGGNTRTPLIIGERNPEVYTFDYGMSKALLTEHCESFAAFLMDNRALIKDRKIFGGNEH